jgi:hypothetical protein
MNKKNNQQRNNKKTKLALFWWCIGGVITIALLISAAVAFPLNFETSLVVSSSNQQSNSSSGEVTTTSLSLVGIEVDKLPSKLTYSAIDTIETNGGILRVVFSDYSVRYVSMNDNMIDTTRLNTSSIGTSRVTLSYSFNGDTLFTSYNVNIVPFVINPISLSLDIASSDVLIDQVVNLNYIIEPSNATYSSIVWSSSNPLIATVDNNGLVTPKNVGEVVITATLDNKLTASSKITVIPVVSIVIETSTPQAPAAPAYFSTLLTLNVATSYDFSDDSDFIEFDLSTNLSVQTAGTLKTRYDINPIKLNSNVFKAMVFTFSAAGGTSYQVNTSSLDSDTVIFVFNAPILDIFTDIDNYDLDATFLFSNDDLSLNSTNSSVSFTSANFENYEFLVLSKNNLGTGSIIVTEFSTFDGYFLSNDTSKPFKPFSLPVPVGTSEAYALTLLPTFLYEKDTNGLFNPANVSWGIADGATYSSVAGNLNLVSGTITNRVTSGNNVSTINSDLRIVAANAIPISSATQLSQIKHYAVSTTVTFGEGLYETTKTFSSSISPMGLKYYLTKDIDLSTFNDGVWIPIGSEISINDRFSGTFDGFNYSILNFNKLTNRRYAGLFGVIRSASIGNFSIYGNLKIDKNLLSQSAIGETGVIVANNYGDGNTSSPTSTIYNVHNYVNIDTNSGPVGGIIGASTYDGRVQVERSSNNGNIKLTIASNSRSGAGGIIGSVLGFNFRGSINILESFNTGTIISTGLAAGGLIGNATTANFLIEDSYNVGEIYAVNEGGGFIGVNTNSAGSTLIARRSFNLSKITRLSGSGTKFGPIVGDNYITVVTGTSTYSISNLVDYNGSLSNGNNLSVSAYRTIAQFKNQDNYDSLYLFGPNSRWLINEGNTSAYLNFLPEVLSASVTELVEGSTPGQVSNNIFNITLSNTAKYFETNLTTADVVANNLPDGLTYSVEFIQFNTIRVTIGETATNHAASSSIDNLSFTINAKINGTTEPYTTRDIKLKFTDPVI